MAEVPLPPNEKGVAPLPPTPQESAKAKSKANQEDAVAATINEINALFTQTPQKQASIEGQKAETTQPTSSEHPGSAPEVKEQFHVTTDPETQKAFTSYANFAEQFSQAQALLEASPDRSVCIYLTHQAPSLLPEDAGKWVDVITAHEVKKRADGTYTVQQLPFVHNAAYNFKDNTTGGFPAFKSILTKGFVGGLGQGRHGRPNTLIYPEGKRQFTSHNGKGDNTESVGFYQLLWESYPSKKAQGVMQGSDAEFLDDEGIFFGVGETPRSEVRGVIVFPSGMPADAIRLKQATYQRELPGYSLTFAQV